MKHGKLLVDDTERVKYDYEIALVMTEPDVYPRAAHLFSSQLARLLGDVMK